MLKHHQVFLFLTGLFGALVCARSSYIVDDSNHSILEFSENSGGPVWSPYGSDTQESLQLRLPNGTMQTVDASQCNDGTFTYAACTTANNCAVQFSFRGTGLTIYVLQAGAQGTSASLSVDSRTATTVTLDPPSSPQYYAPHVVLFDVQNMPFGLHSAVMTVLDWNGEFSGMMLDDICINEVGSQVAYLNTSSSSPAASASSGSASQITSPVQSATYSTPQSSLGAGSPSTLSSSSVSTHSSGATVLASGISSTGDSTASSTLSSTSKKKIISAIVGGTIGGVALVAILALALYFFCRHRRRNGPRGHQRLQEPDSGRPSPLLRFTPYEMTDADPFASLPILPATPASTRRTSQSLLSWASSATGFSPSLGSATRTPGGSLAGPPVESDWYVVPGRGADSATTSFTPASIGVASAAVASHVQDRDAPALKPIQSAHAQPAVGRRPGGKARQVPRDSSWGLAGAPTTTTRPSKAVLVTGEEADFVNGLFGSDNTAPVVVRVMSGDDIDDLPDVYDPDINPGSLLPVSERGISGVWAWRPPRPLG